MKILENYNVVFIVGCQRTGTTLTGNILAAHPNVFMIDEPDGVYPWAQAIFSEQNEDLINTKFQDACKKASQKYKNSHIKCNIDGTLTDVITHIVLKVPNLTFNAAEIIKYFANPYCVFTYRDIRDVVVSMGRLHWISMVENQLNYIESNPLVLKRYNQEVEILKSGKLKPHQARAYIAKIKTNLRVDFNREELNRIIIKYEDLTQNPEMWTKTILQHVGLRHNLDDLDYTDKLLGWGPGLTYRKNKINTFSIGQWKEFLSKEDESEVWEIIEPLMLELGYSRRIDKIESNSKWSSLTLKYKKVPVIATGRGGSGTRLLSKLLQNMGIFLGNKMGRMEDSLEWVNILARISTERSMDEGKKEISHLRTALQETAADILTSANLDQNKRWGWKLPETMLAVPELFDAFPDAKLIHLVRHPVNSSLRRTHVTSRADNLVGKSVLRAAYQSLNWKKYRINSDPDYLRNAATWLYQVGMVTRYARENLNPSNYMELHFEELCLSPIKTFSKIAKFLGANVDGLKPNLEIEPNRMRSWQYPDPRADEVWDICANLATTLGYKKIES
ncbi:MAG: sulfotransferase [Marinicellaceae bacterium]